MVKVGVDNNMVVGHSYEMENGIERVEGQRSYSWRWSRSMLTTT